MPARGSLRRKPNYETVRNKEPRRRQDPKMLSAFWFGFLDAQRSDLPWRRILRPEHDPHRVGIEIDFPGGNAGPDELLGIVGCEPLGGGVEEFHELHAHLEIGAAIPARGNADTHIVVELTTDEALGHLEQPSHDHALQADAVLAAEAPCQHARARGIGAERQKLAADLRMRPPTTLRLTIPLRLRAGGEVVTVEFEKLGHRGVDVHAARGRGTPPSGDEVSDVDLRHLNRVRQFTWGALQLAQPASDQLTDFDGALQG